MTCVYCHEDFAGTPTACPNCGLPTSDPGAPGRNSLSVLDRTLSWSRTSFAGFFDRLRHSPGGVWAIPLAVGLVAGLFLGLGYTLGYRGGEQPVAQNPEPKAAPAAASPQTPVQTASASLPDAITPVITQAFSPTAEEEPLPPRPEVVTPAAREGDGVDYFAEPKAVKSKPKRAPRLRYPNWAMYETTRSSMPPPHVLAMNPYRERSPIYVYMMGIEHPYLGDVSTSYQNDGGQFGPGPRLDFTGE